MKKQTINAITMQERRIRDIREHLTEFEAALVSHPIAIVSRIVLLTRGLLVKQEIELVYLQRLAEMEKVSQ